MPKQDINFGAFDGDQNADCLRQAFAKTVNNFNELYTLLGQIQPDGNQVFIERNNTNENIEPSATESPSPIEGDTAEVNLMNQIIEKWAFLSGSWIKRYKIDIPQPQPIIVNDGNHVLIFRPNLIENVQPTTSEIPTADLVDGDTAEIRLNSDRLEKWRYLGGSWVRQSVTDIGNIPKLIGDLLDVNAPAASSEAGMVLKVDDNGDWVAAYRKIISSPALQINTSTVLTNKINETINLNRTGKYRVTVNFGFSVDLTTGDFVSRMLLDGSPLSALPVNEITRIEPKDSTGDDGDGRGTDQKSTASISYLVDITAAGAKTINVQFATSQNGVEASMWDLMVVIEEEFGIIEV